MVQRLTLIELQKEDINKIITSGHSYNCCNLNLFSFLFSHRTTSLARQQNHDDVEQQRHRVGQSWQADNKSFQTWLSLKALPISNTKKTKEQNQVHYWKKNLVCVIELNNFLLNVYKTF